MPNYQIKFIDGMHCVVNGNDITARFETNELALFLIQLLTGDNEFAHRATIDWMVPSPSCSPRYMVSSVRS